MPYGDKTGPSRVGPMTGRSAGFCAGFNSPGFTRGGGRGMQAGFRGVGNRNRFRNRRLFLGASWETPGQDLEEMKQHVDVLERQLADIKNTINSIESNSQD